MISYKAEQTHMPMKTIIKTSLATAVAAASIGNAQAATFYTTNTTQHATSGTAWNTQADGLGTDGSSTTYNVPENDLIIQSGHTIRSHANSDNANTIWNSNSISLNGTFHTGAKLNTTSTFNTNITVTTGAKWSIATNAAIVNGSGNLVLSDQTLLMQHSSSGSTGSLDFGLNIDGSGTIDLGYASENLGYIAFNNLSSDFTGTIDASKANNMTLKFAAGNGAFSSRLLLGRSGNDKLVKLDLDGNYSIGELKIDNIGIADGTYTYADLVALNGTFADNLIDNGGLISVGVAAVPEPSTSALFGLAGLTLLARRRR